MLLDAEREAARPYGWSSRPPDAPTGGWQLHTRTLHSTGTSMLGGGDAHGALLASIRKGRALKKVENEPKKKQEPQGTAGMGGVSVAAILARRAALAVDGSDDSDSDDAWDD